ncbi:hypothetical protein SAMN05444280_108151 [Tangfeifania diversioriginum]|uniref:Uncharacterized protein n=1 Tax=Tangfeifania diversioriginum TaxID=1168035 RepID=A0A1M6FFG3_9BACT|nr:hypothetical protein SAMN05444280_108151 [Tangfeifania diversioriginum]
MEKSLKINCEMEEKTFFYKLLLDGNFDFCHDDCKIKEFSEMSLFELIEKTRGMSSMEIRTIISRHEDCLRNYWRKSAS